MSSETSTEHGRSPDSTASSSSSGMQPWQFFTLAGLGCASAVTFLARSQGFTSVILLSLLMGTTVLVGMAALRAIRPLVSEHEDRSAVIGERTRAALEQEKALALRTIKELEFDRAMGKLSEDDFREMSVRLRARAGRLIKQLDAGSGYRALIEKDLLSRLGDIAASKSVPSPRASHTCAACGAANDADARFCKGCGVARARACPACSTSNDADARFCKSCGGSLA